MCVDACKAGHALLSDHARAACERAFTNTAQQCRKPLVHSLGYRFIHCQLILFVPMAHSTPQAPDAGLPIDINYNKLTGACVRVRGRACCAGACRSRRGGLL